MLSTVVCRPVTEAVPAMIIHICRLLSVFVGDAKKKLWYHLVCCSLFKRSLAWPHCYFEALDYCWSCVCVCVCFGCIHSCVHELQQLLFSQLLPLIAMCSVCARKTALHSSRPYCPVFKTIQAAPLLLLWDPSLLPANTHCFITCLSVHPPPQFLFPRNILTNTK